MLSLVWLLVFPLIIKVTAELLLDEAVHGCVRYLACDNKLILLTIIGDVFGPALHTLNLKVVGLLADPIEEITWVLLFLLCAAEHVLKCCLALDRTSWARFFTAIIFIVGSLTLAFIEAILASATAT